MGDEPTLDALDHFSQRIEDLLSEAKRLRGQIDASDIPPDKKREMRARIDERLAMLQELLKDPAS